MISTHILDTSLGKPAEGVAVSLHIKDRDKWSEISRGHTDSDGRHNFSGAQPAGLYQIIFEIEDYFNMQQRPCFFLNTPVLFKIENTQRKYHVPLLLNPFGYSTYRGS